MHQRSISAWPHRAGVLFLHTWLQVEMDGDQLVSAVIDKEETARVRARIQEKLNRLRSGDYLDEG